MDIDEFCIGQKFYCGDRVWRCTDRGSRTIVAICIDAMEIVMYSSTDKAKRYRTLSRDEAEKQGWFNGPPYAVAESVFDECDLGGCSLQPDCSADG